MIVFREVHKLNHRRHLWDAVGSKKKFSMNRIKSIFKKKIIGDWKYWVSKTTQKKLNRQRKQSLI